MLVCVCVLIICNLSLGSVRTFATHLLAANEPSLLLQQQKLIALAACSSAERKEEEEKYD